MSQVNRFDNLASYYNKFSISPVRQNIKSYKNFFNQRKFLYQRLGLLKSNFINKTIIEIGPGPGLNSLYISSLKPKKYILVDAGDSSIKLIKKNFKNFKISHTKPSIIKSNIEELKIKEKFDVVICEGVIVRNKDYVKNYKKLFTLLKNNGILITTFYPLIGSIPNALRKLIFYLSFNKNLSFKEKTNRAIKFFSSHLAKIKLTRPKSDWVQDVILNTFFLKQNIDLKTLNKIYKDKLFFHACYPNFYTNWDWYKDEKYKDTKYNNIKFIKTYSSNYNNFLNYLDNYPNDIKQITINEYKKIKITSEKIINQVNNLTDGKVKIFNKKYFINLLTELSKFLFLSKHSKESINEIIKILSKSITKQNNFKTIFSKKLNKFKKFFGREYCYISLFKN